MRQRPDRSGLPGRIRARALPRALALAMAAVFAAPLSVQASNEIFHSSDDVQAVDDGVLESLRGRWSGPSGFQSIGIDLRSVWQTPDGARLQAGVSIDIDAQSINRGEARVTTQASITPGAVPRVSMAGADRAINGSDPSRSAAGLVQLLQLAGDRNAANNRLLFDVVRGSRDAAPLVSEAAAASSNASSSATADGMSASARAGAGGLIVELDVPGLGTLSQRMGRSLEAPGVKQSIRVAGDDQMLQNVAALRLTMTPVTARSMAIDNLARSLSSTIGLRR